MKRTYLFRLFIIISLLIAYCEYPLFSFSKYRTLIEKIKKRCRQQTKLNPFIQAFFPPRDKLRPLICALLEEEIEQIDIEAFQLTDKEIAETLLRAYKTRGVKIRIIADISALGRYSKIVQLYNAGIPVYIHPQENAPSRQYALMHNKIILLHSLSCVITGSMNFTKSGLEENAENVVIMQSKELFKQYYQQFMWLTQKATALGHNVE